MNGHTTTQSSLDIVREGDTLTVTLGGRFDAEATARHWTPLSQALGQLDGVRRIQVDLEGVAYCDGAGAGLLIEIQRTIHGKEIELTLSGAPEPLRRMLSMFPVEKFLDVHRRPPPVSPIVVVGKATVEVLQLAAETIAFIGEVMAEAFRVARHPRLLRWADALLTVERAGVDAVPIVLLLSFLFGLILAFQSAMPLKQFGAEVYVADFLAIALMRELGPLLTSVILAGRSGSAFAAELGTMQVNEEIAALKTMGLSPVRFLALPRVLAGGFVCPLLSVFSILVGLVGGAVVLLAMGYPLVTYVDHVLRASKYMDLISGLVKAAVFGLLVSGTGCLQGLRTGHGASAVGQSTTRAVVSGLVLIIVADGVFAVLSYAIGI